MKQEIRRSHAGLATPPKPPSTESLEELERRGEAELRRGDAAVDRVLGQGLKLSQLKQTSAE